MGTRKLDSVREVLQESVRVRSSEILSKPEKCYFAWEVLNKSVRVLTCWNPKHKFGGEVCKLQDCINGQGVEDMYTILNFNELFDNRYIGPRSSPQKSAEAKQVCPANNKKTKCSCSPGVVRQGRVQQGKGKASFLLVFTSVLLVFNSFLLVFTSFLLVFTSF